MTGPERHTRWSQIAGARSGEQYAARFAALAAEGGDVHGEATFCATLVPAGSRVLDAGCGTGRVAVRLAELGYDPVGVDVDRSMLDVARATAPSISWVLADLASLDFGDPEGFGLVVAAGNVVPLLAEDTLTGTVAGLAAQLAPEGLLVAGFGLDDAHLPPGCPVTSLAAYDEVASAAGLSLLHRFGTWDGDAYAEGGGYAVSVHRQDSGRRRQRRSVAGGAPSS